MEKGLLCKLFGHKPVQPFLGMPVYCKRCLKDLSVKNGRYIADDTIFDKMFLENIHRSSERVKELYGRERKR